MRASFLSRRTRRASVNSFRTTIAYNVRAKAEVAFWGRTEKRGHALSGEFRTRSERPQLVVKASWERVSLRNEVRNWAWTTRPPQNAIWAKPQASGRPILLVVERRWLALLFAVVVRMLTSTRRARRREASKNRTLNFLFLRAHS